MTDKIIIDGVDVSGCNYYAVRGFVQSYNGYTEYQDYCANPLTSRVCTEYPNCYYKQLQRKTAKCQELINENDKLQEANEQYAGINKNLDYMLGDVISKVLEDDNTEEYFYTELKEKFTSKLEDIIEQNKQNERYKQALDDIEEYCREQNLKADWTACEILDIIKKTKDGE